MRVCLQCDSEYLDDPVHCRSCGAETVSQAEAEFQRELRDSLATEELIEIFRFDSPVDQAILSKLFTDAEVPFAVKGGQSGPMPGVGLDQGGWGSLLVPEDQVEAGQRIVRRYQSSVVIEHPDDDQD